MKRVFKLFLKAMYPDSNAPWYKIPAGRQIARDLSIEFNKWRQSALNRSGSKITDRVTKREIRLWTGYQ